MSIKIYHFVLFSPLYDILSITSRQWHSRGQRFGPEIPIGMVLDLHGNITPEMMELSDITVGFQCYPHTDTYECGRLLHEQHTTGKPLHQALVQLPWHIAPAFGVTLSGPAHDVMLYNQQLVKEDPTLRDITFFQGFPYSDVPLPVPA